MQTVLSTAGLPAAEAFDWWMEANSARLTTRRAWTPHDRLSFSAYLRAGALCDLTVMDWRVTPIDAGDWGDKGEVVVSLPRNRATLRFADDSCLEYSGNAVYLIDGTPFKSRLSEPSEFTALRIPRAALARRLHGVMPKVVNRPVLLQGDAALLEAQLRSLIRIGPSTLSPPAAAAAREHLLDLVALTFAPLADAAPKLGASAYVLTLRLKTAIEAQFANPDADRASICAAAGISERHANRILAHEGTSVMELLRERRLEKCRLALEKTDRPVSEIAYSCGYGDVSNFARAFRARYGLTPTRFRHSGS